MGHITHLNKNSWYHSISVFFFLHFPSIFQQLRIYTILEYLHNNQTSCSIVVVEKIFKHFPSILSILNFEPLSGPWYQSMGTKGHEFNDLESSFCIQALV